MLEPSLRSPDVQVLRPACSSSWMSDESWTASGNSISKLDCPKNCLSTCCPSCKLCNAALHASADAETRNDDASLSVAGAISALRLPWNDAIRSKGQSRGSESHQKRSDLLIGPGTDEPSAMTWLTRSRVNNQPYWALMCWGRESIRPIHERKKVPQAFTTWCPSEAFWS